jgi:hypothetical protein
MAVVTRETSSCFIDLGALDGAELNHFAIDDGSFFYACGDFLFDGHRILVPEDRRGMLVPQKDQETAA